MGCEVVVSVPSVIDSMTMQLSTTEQNRDIACNIIKSNNYGRIFAAMNPSTTESRPGNHAIKDTPACASWPEDSMPGRLGCAAAERAATCDLRPSTPQNFYL